MTNHVIIKNDRPYQVEFARTPRGSAPSKEFLMSLPERPRKKISAWIDRLELEGPNMTRPYADVLAGPIRELRISFGRLEMRMLYFIHDRSIVLTHGFLKKTREIPPAEIDRAERLRALWLTEQEAS